MRAVGVLSLGGAILALVVHVLAVAGHTPFGMGMTFILFVIAFPSWWALLRDAKARAPRTGKALGFPFSLFSTIPIWGRALFGIVFLYTAINFFAFFVATAGGTLEQRPDGHFVLSDHGRFILDLDEQGVRDFRTWEVRLFSGHILPFLVLPGLYFLFTPSLAEAEERATSSST